MASSSLLFSRCCPLTTIILVCILNLIVITGGFTLSIKKTRPVLGLKSLLQVSVDKYFNATALCSDWEGAYFFWRGKVTKDKRTKNWWERAPVTNDFTGL